VVVSLGEIMALSKQRHNEIDQELQQIKVRLSTIADELAKETASGNHYKLAFQTTEYLAKHMDFLRLWLTSAQQLG